MLIWTGEGVARRSFALETRGSCGGRGRHRHSTGERLKHQAYEDYARDWLSSPDGRVPRTSISESLESGWEAVAPVRKGSMGWPILAMREMSLALVASGFCSQDRAEHRAEHTSASYTICSVHTL